uniref:Uncharacterized protein n=1 Tax=Glossina pallidipes TaxID=7398 RepID=A0A1B0A423_GLOPL
MECPRNNCGETSWPIPFLIRRDVSSSVASNEPYFPLALKLQLYIKRSMIFLVQPEYNSFKQNEILFRFQAVIACVTALRYPSYTGFMCCDATRYKRWANIKFLIKQATSFPNNLTSDEDVEINLKSIVNRETLQGLLSTFVKEKIFIAQ